MPKASLKQFIDHPIWQNSMKLFHCSFCVAINSALVAFNMKGQWHNGGSALGTIALPSRKSFLFLKEHKSKN